MSVSTSPSAPNPSASESIVEILRLKRKLVTTCQELDEARGVRPKKIP